MVRRPLAAAADWNSDGADDGVLAEGLNSNGNGGSTCTNDRTDDVLTGFHDWDNLVRRGRPRARPDTVGQVRPFEEAGTCTIPDCGEKRRGSYLEGPVQGIAPVDLYRGGAELGEMQELGKVGITVGVGFFGTAERGPEERNGRRRAVTSKIVNVEEAWLETYFSRPPGGTDLEGVAAAGDSGGPLLVERDGQVLLVGLGSYSEYIDAEGGRGATAPSTSTSASRATSTGSTR